MSDVYVKAPSKRQIVVNGANVDRFVAILEGYREEQHPDSLSELVTLIKATEQFAVKDLRLMFAIMLQREADRR